MPALFDFDAALLKALVEEVGLRQAWLNILATRLKTRSDLAYVLDDPLFADAKMLSEDVLEGHDAQTKPSHALLLEAGHKKQKLRAHSDFMWNRACNHWALGFAEQFDIQVEAKGKNLASAQVCEQL